VTPKSVATPNRLDSWKEIADYLKRDVRTVRRWEKSRRLPVHRVPGGNRQSVFAYTEEIERWLQGQPELPLDEPQNASPSEAASTPAPRLTLRWRFALSAFLAAVVVGMSLWRWRQEPPIRSIAVLPFVNLSGDGNQDYFSDGMTELLTLELAKVPSLRVISRTSAMRYKTTPKSAREIAQELGVEALIEGSLAREGDVVRIAVQLIDARTDSHLWSDSYERTLNSVMAVQEDIARSIVAKVRLAGPASTADGPHRVGVEAYQLYLRGRYLLNRRVEAQLHEAIKLLERAVEIEPGYAAAHAALAEGWEGLSSWAGYLPPKEGFPKSKAAALKALSLDETLPEAHTALGFVFEVYDWNLEAAAEHYQRAIALNPNYVLAQTRYSLYLLRTDKIEAALNTMRRVVLLDPLTLDNLVQLAIRLNRAGRSDEALAMMRRAVAIEPTYFDTYVHLSHLYQDLNLHADAIAAAEKGVNLSSRGPHALEALARAYANDGRKAEAEAITDEMERNPRRRNAYEIAYLRLLLGDVDRAFDLLIAACEERTPAMAFFRFAEGQHLFKSVRDNRRFSDVLRCVDAGSVPASTQ